MIDPNLFRSLRVLQTDSDRLLCMVASSIDFEATRGCNALFLAAVEIPQACMDYPVVFAQAGQDAQGRVEVAPLAVLGLERGENLMLEPSGAWRASYVPAILQSYPLGLMRTEGGRYTVCVDADSKRLFMAKDAQDTRGERLLDDAGQPTAFMTQLQAVLERLEGEAERTRLVSRQLQELELLTPTRFDATTPEGQSITVDGFLSVDEAKLNDLSDDVLLALARSGVLKVIQAQLMSLAHFKRLVERRMAHTRGS
jgi:hypothetical protein